VKAGARHRASEAPRVLRRSAEQAARLAGRLLARRFTGARTIEYKGGIDLVTDADRASERALLGFLRRRHPGHGVLAEESGLTRGERVRWVVDPLDGTTNYAHRVPHFCVSVAAEVDGRMVAGAVYDPIRRELFSAARGGGATLNGKRIRPSGLADLDRALMCTGFPYDVRERPEAPVGLFARVVRKVQGVRRMGSAALDLAYVACGRYDGFWEFGLKPWDVAAGGLLVEEAGGIYCGIDGGPFDLARGDVLACGRPMEARLKEEVAGFLRQARAIPGR
jgi:myo-inositol-1(or 4)-monophosphatase